MFDIGWTELLLVAVVAIIVVGPKDLPRMLRTLGQYAGQLRRTANEFRDQFDDALREAELDELRSGVEGLGDLNPMNQIKDAIGDTFDPLKETAESFENDLEQFKSQASVGPPKGTSEPAKETGDNEIAGPDHVGVEPESPAGGEAAESVGNAAKSGA